MASGGQSIGKTSEEAFDYICSVCDRQNKTTEAVKYCVECKDYCCQPCMDMHKIFSTLSSHSFLDVGLGHQSGSKTSDFPTERCCIHNGKILDMYCESHNVVACCTCIAKDHKSCPDNKIYSVPDMLDTLLKFSDSQQTQSRLKQMIGTMTTLSKSKDARLEKLSGARQEAMDQVAKFQTALEAIFRKAADVSRNEIEEGFKKIRDEIRQDKVDVDDTSQVLQDADNKIKKAAGNKAQRFVCSKIAEKNIKVAEDEKIKQEKNDNADVGLSFIPSKPLMKYIQSLHGIGEVQIGKKKKQDLYKMISSRDINIKVPSDSSDCSSFGCCLTNDHQLLVTDCDNKNLKRVDVQTMKVIDHCSLNGTPFGLCCISEEIVAVACRIPYKVQFVSIQDKMIPTRTFDLPGNCYGIAVKGDKLYVSGDNTTLHVYDMTGKCLRTISKDSAGNYLFSDCTHITFNESSDKMLVSDFRSKLVCFDGRENYQSTITDSDLSGVDGVCTDGRGNIFVVGRYSETVVQYNEDGTKIGVILKGQDGLQQPSSVSFHQGLNRIFVTMVDSNVLKMYDLE
ncbi:hypothetical protein ACF0H5_013416 [Mactra antiquata]